MQQQRIEIRTTAKTQPQPQTLETKKDIIIRSVSTHQNMYEFSVTCDIEGNQETFSAVFYDEYVHCYPQKLTRCEGTHNAMKFLGFTNFSQFIKLLAGVIFCNPDGIHIEYIVAKKTSTSDVTPQEVITNKELRFTISYLEGSFTLRLT